MIFRPVGRGEPKRYEKNVFFLSLDSDSDPDDSKRYIEEIASDLNLRTLNQNRSLCRFSGDLRSLVLEMDLSVDGLSEFTLSVLTKVVSNLADKIGAMEERLASLAPLRCGFTGKE